MITKKKFRILLLLYLNYFIISAAIGFNHGIAVKQHINSASEKISQESSVVKTEQPIFLHLLAPFIWFIGMIVVVLQIFSFIALFRFWRIAPALFCVFIAISEILLPILTTWYENKTIQYTISYFPEKIWDKMVFLEPLHAISLILTGVILASIYLFDGKKCF